MDDWKIPTGQLDPVGPEPFTNDLFERRALATRLTKLIVHMKEGCVIGVDAPWGDGKTWFGKNWEADLQEQAYKTVYLDAFKTDYFEDPYLALSGAILTLLEKANPQSENIRKSLIEIGKTLLPMGSRILISALTRWTLGSAGSEAIKEFREEVEQGTSKIAEDLFEKRLKEYETEKESLNNLRRELSKLALSETKPIFFFVDELDRCKPTYAIKMLERIKHFFDVPGLIFVLMINRRQLERAVEGVYGLKGEEATEYLQKFVHFFLQLPKRRQFGPPGEKDFHRIYGRELAKRFGLATEQDLEGKIGDFIDALAIFAFLMDFSLRDLEKAFILFSLFLATGTGPSNLPIGPISFYVAYLISLKIKYPKIFSLLKEDDSSRQGHRKGADLIDHLIKKAKSSQGIVSPALDSILKLHEAQVGEFIYTQPTNFQSPTSLLQDVYLYFQKNGISFKDPKLLIPSIIKRLDLAID